MLSENPEDVILEALSEIRQAEIGLVELLASLRSGQDENRDPKKPGGTIVVFTKKRRRESGSSRLPLKHQEKR